MIKTVPKDLHIAPMLDVSTVEFLNFFRILTKRAVLWTEMVVDETVMHTKELNRHLPYAPDLNPIVVQIGGIKHIDSGKATKLIVESFGYDQVNLNIDCPSNRVCGKQFGAILMHQSENARQIVSAMKRNAQNVPISVKTRVGIELESGESFDTLDYLVEFISKLRQEGCYKYVIHARKCILGGLSPSQNRLIPPLNYDRVYKLCKSFPDCEFVINGGIPGLKKAKRLCYGHRPVEEPSCSISYSDSNRKLHAVPCELCGASNGSCVVEPLDDIPNLRGCMIGRAAMENPCMFWDVDRYFYGEETNPCQNRRELLDSYCKYLEFTYPRQCCSNNSYRTGGCIVCKDIYGNGESGQSIRSCDVNTATLIPSGIVDRSLKPVLGVFFNRPMSKSFRRECDKLSRDLRIRNCGPGYILRKAFSIMPNEILDEPFVFTEDILDSDVPVHVGPQTRRNDVQIKCNRQHRAVSQKAGASKCCLIGT
jgi:tRNA-dihydrouridine synthase A